MKARRCSILHAGRCRARVIACGFHREEARLLRTGREGKGLFNISCRPVPCEGYCLRGHNVKALLIKRRVPVNGWAVSFDSRGSLCFCQGGTTPENCVTLYSRFLSSFACT